jgi:hypothetical protein
MNRFNRQSFDYFSPLLLLVLTFFILQACQAITEPLGVGYEYYPLETGTYRLYEVTEERFVLGGAPSTQHYQLREVTTDSSLNLAGGNMTFRIERFRRATDQQAWQPDSVVSVRLVDDQLIKTENNTAYIKLVFPLSEQLQWNGNAYNTLGEDRYQLRYMGKPFSVLNQTFPETVTVIQQNDSTLVNQDKRLDVYARNVGLVYQERIQLQFCSSTPSCIGNAQIDYGFRQYIRLRSYGKL